MAGYNTGFFHAIIYWPWPPKVEVEVQDYHVMALGVPAGSVAFSSRCSPSTYLGYVVFVFYTLLWVALLVQGKVRDETSIKSLSSWSRWSLSTMGFSWDMKDKRGVTRVW